MDDRDQWDQTASDHRLKMIAWEDRPEVRPDDITDICDILDHYFDMHSEEIYTNHVDIFEDEAEANASLIDISARVLGRELNRIARRNQKLFDRISNLIERSTKDVQTSRWAEVMIRYFSNTVEDNFRLLGYIKKGFAE
jgi:predicted nucleotidyltransferase